MSVQYVAGDVRSATARVCVREEHGRVTPDAVMDTRGGAPLRGRRVKPK